MTNIILTPGKKFLRAGGGKFLSMVAGSGNVTPPPGTGGVPQPGSPTTMAMQDFVTGHARAMVIMQRKAGTNYADLTVSYTYTGNAPGNPQARVVRKSDGSTVKDWTTLSNVTNTNGAGSGILPGVGLGGPYYLQLRDGNATGNVQAQTNGTVMFGVGINILLMGQSNMVGTFSSGSYSDLVPGAGKSELDYYDAGSVCGAFFGQYGWTIPYGGPGLNPSGASNIAMTSGATLGFLRIVAAALRAKYGFDVPVGLIPRAFGSTGIEQYYTNGSMLGPLFSGSGLGGANADAGFQSPPYVFNGDIEGFCWHQGENNQADSRPTYFGKLKTLYQGLLDHVAKFGRTANDLFFLPAMLGSYTNNLGTENIRGAELDLDAYARANGWPRARLAWNCIDLDPAINSDGLHFQDNAPDRMYKRLSSRRVMQSVLWQLGCSTYSGLGPKIASVGARTNNVVRLNVAHEGGTALTAPNGSALSGFVVSNVQDFNGTFTPVAAVISGPSTIDVTLPGDGTWYLKYMGGYPSSTVQFASATESMKKSAHPDLTNPVYDNAPYPVGAVAADGFTGLPLLPTPDALVIG